MVKADAADHPKTVLVECMHCSGPTKHEIVKELVVNEHIEEADITLEDTYQIIRCRGCGRVSFRNRWWQDDMLDEEGDPVVQTKVYPDRIPGLKEMEGLQYLPDIVRQIYKETIIVLRTGEGSILASLGIRTIIEAVCKEKKARGDNLQQKIDYLVGEGWLSLKQAEFLHQSRLLGNVAAHELRSPSPSTMKGALQIVENLLETVYVLPALKAKMKV